jgi:hypothetical protein
VHESFGSVVAQIADVSLVEGADPKVNRVVTAIDCGTAISPDQIAAQMEGGTCYGLSAALYGETTLKDGMVQETNFETYRVLRLPEAPVVETHILPSGNPPSGVGEPGTPVITAALALMQSPRQFRVLIIDSQDGVGGTFRRGGALYELNSGVAVGEERLDLNNIPGGVSQARDFAQGDYPSSEDISDALVVNALHIQSDPRFHFMFGARVNTVSNSQLEISANPTNLATGRTSRLLNFKVNAGTIINAIGPGDVDVRRVKVSNTVTRGTIPEESFNLPLVLNYGPPAVRVDPSTIQYQIPYTPPPLHRAIA